MDESERRKEWLKAMRIEAAQGEPSSVNQVQVSGLSNPLTDASSLQEMPRSAPRFDYYTDPMASFVANRRGSVGSPGPRGFVSSPGPRGFVPSPGHGRATSMGQMLPHPEPWNPRMTMRPMPGPAAYQARGSFTGSLPCGVPTGSENPFLPHHEMPPGVGNPPGYAVNYHPQSNFSRGANFPNHGGRSGWHDSGFGQGRGRSFQGSYSGRGRGNWADNKVRMGSEHSHNRNQGSTNPVPKSLYEKFMVDDPWKSLTPSVWREETPEISLPVSKTVGVKRPLEISTPAVSNSQSLAEYLADSFNEAVKGDPSV
ncbi:unnamed protein product [Rhodiola kirilowii]